MKRHWRAGAALLSGVISFACGATDIAVQISPHSVIDQTPSSVVTVTVHNMTADAVYIPKSLSPLYTPGDHLMTKVFDVADSSGNEASFIGRMVRVAPRDPETFFFRIEPGQSMSHDVDLAADYDLSAGGAFNVSYDQAYTKTVHTDANDEIDSPLEYQGGHPATVWVGPAVSPRQSRKFSRLLTPVTSDGQQCTDAQLSTIRSAVSLAYSVSMNSLNGIKALYTVVEGRKENGDATYQGQISADNAYTYWFGAPQNTGKQYASPPSYTDYWKVDDDFVMMRFMNSVTVRIGNGRYFCGCPRYDARTAAWTIPESQTITFCEGFFNLKQIDGFYDSQVLTVIHEVSHYIDWTGPGTGDYAYGRTWAHSLAVSSKHKAVRNADNIAYYESTYIH